MVRSLLSACLVFTTLLGPMMCCCTLQASTSTAISERAAEASPVSLHRKSCCEAELPAKENSKLPAPKPGCPCKKQQLDQGLVALSIHQSESFTGLNRELACFLVADDFRIAKKRSDDTSRSRNSARDIPFRSGRDILIAHHVLTC